MLYPFKVRVVAYKGSPREFELVLTSSETMAKIVNGENLGCSNLNLYFPERWLGALEIHGLMNTLAKRHSYLETVSILTAHPQILTDFPSNVIAILEDYKGGKNS